MQTAWTGSRSKAAIALLVVTAFFAQAFVPQQADAADRRRVTMLELTNQDRSQHDRAALALNEKLSRYAKRHSREMAEAGYLFHSEDLAARLNGLDWTIGGENVGVGTTLDGLEQAFMDSTPHRKNILKPTYDHTAIGIVRSDGKFWVTVIFYG
ncbi:MAG: CAP domain-containing protein [Candidatus Velamenicoccus archaeovorus]